jgi:hypothetical protein
MVGIMKIACGLKFTGIICEDEETARNYLVQQEWVAKYLIDDCYEFIPVAYVTKDLEIK